MAATLAWILVAALQLDVIRGMKEAACHKVDVDNVTARPSKLAECCRVHGPREPDSKVGEYLKLQKGGDQTHLFSTQYHNENHLSCLANGYHHFTVMVKYEDVWEALKQCVNPKKYGRLRTKSLLADAGCSKQSLDSSAWSIANKQCRKHYFLDASTTSTDCRDTKVEIDGCREGDDDKPGLRKAFRDWWETANCKVSVFDSSYLNSDKCLIHAMKATLERYDKIWVEQCKAILKAC